LIVREILVLSFIASEKNRKKDGAIHRYHIFSDHMTNLITHIDKCLLKWIWFNTNRRYKWHCCLPLFWVTNESITMHSVHLPFQCSKVYRLHDQNNQDNSFNFRFQIGNNQQSKKTTCKLGENSSFSFFLKKTGKQDFLLDIYSTYKNFVWTAALGLEFSGSNDIVLILPLY
jgi:hypothetical protein